MAKLKNASASVGWWKVRRITYGQ